MFRVAMLCEMKGEKKAKKAFKHTLFFTKKKTRAHKNKKNGKKKDALKKTTKIVLPKRTGKTVNFSLEGTEQKN